MAGDTITIRAGGKFKGLRTLGQMAASLMNRSRFANVAGITFKGKRDLYEALGYQRVIFPADYRSRFDRNAVAARVCEAKPKDTWRGGAEVVEDDDVEKITEFEQAFIDLNERLKIWPTLENADTLAGIGHYGIVVFGAPGNLNEPLDRCKPEELVYLTPYSEEDAKVAEFDLDERSPRYGLPKYYDLLRSTNRYQTQAVAGTTPSMAKRVHFSRVLHIADGRLDDRTYAPPRMERVWNLLDDLEKVTGGGAEAFWKRADQGQQFDIDPTMDLSTEQIEEMQEEVDKYVHGQQRILRTRGVKVNSLGSDVAGFKDPVDSIIAQISAGTGIPQRILMGSEQAKLAATEDRSKWDEGIEARRASFAGPAIVRPLIDRFMELGILPKVKTYDVVWSQIKTLDEEDKLAIAEKAASVNAKQGETVITTNEIREKFLGLDPLDAEEIVPIKPRNPQPNEPAAASGKGASYLGILRAADRFRPRLKRVTKSAFAAGRKALDKPTLKRALEHRDEMGVLVQVSKGIEAFEKAFKAKFEKVIGDTMAAGGAAAAKTLNKQLAAKRRNAMRAAAPKLKPEIDRKIEFDKTNPNAVAWIKDHAAETITDINETTRKEIRQAVEDAFEKQFDVDELADEIADILGDDARADTIARTETMRASNEGQQSLWDQAVEDGMLPATAEQEWIVTPDDRLCPYCEPMDGQTTEVDGQFDYDGDQIDGPPAHPNCRCTVGIKAGSL